MNDKIHQMEFIFDKQMSWIASADSKTSPTFKIATFLLSVIAILITQIPTWNYFLIFAGAISSISLLISLIFIFFTIFPRTREINPSIIYFGSIAKIGRQNFLETFEKYNENQYINDLSEQCFRTAEIAKKKHKHIKSAIIMIYIAIPPWLIFLWKVITVRTNATLPF